MTTSVGYRLMLPFMGMSAILGFYLKVERPLPARLTRKRLPYVYIIRRTAYLRIGYYPLVAEASAGRSGHGKVGP